MRIPSLLTVLFVSVSFVGVARATRILPGIVVNESDHPICRIVAAKSPKDGTNNIWQKSASFTTVFDAKSPADCIAPKAKKQIDLSAVTPNADD
jgi:hypothetical protein